MTALCERRVWPVPAIHWHPEGKHAPLLYLSSFVFLYMHLSYWSLSIYRYIHIHLFIYHIFFRFDFYFYLIYTLIKIGPNVPCWSEGNFPYWFFSQLFCMYFEWCFALCCASGLKEMFVNLTEVQVIFCQDIICFSTDYYYFLTVCICFLISLILQLCKAAGFSVAGTKN